MGALPGPPSSLLDSRDAVAGGCVRRGWSRLADQSPPYFLDAVKSEWGVVNWAEQATPAGL